MFHKQDKHTLNQNYERCMESSLRSMHRGREGRSGGSSVTRTAVTNDAMQKAALSGGDRTKAKSDILGGYLNDYTTALEWMPFRLDRKAALAGTGEVLILTVSQDHEQLVAGTLKVCWICEEDG